MDGILVGVVVGNTLGGDEGGTLGGDEGVDVADALDLFDLLILICIDYFHISSTSCPLLSCLSTRLSTISIVPWLRLDVVLQATVQTRGHLQ